LGRVGEIFPSDKYSETRGKSELEGRCIIDPWLYKYLEIKLYKYDAIIHAYE